MTPATLSMAETHSLTEPPSSASSKVARHSMTCRSRFARSQRSRPPWMLRTWRSSSSTLAPARKPRNSSAVVSERATAAAAGRAETSSAMARTEWVARVIGVEASGAGNRMPPPIGRGLGRICVGAGRARGAGVSDLADVGGLKSLRALDDLELDVVALGERAEPLGNDGGVVHEHVFATVLRYEAESLRIIEPLDRALRHCCNLLKREPAGSGETPGLRGRVKMPQKQKPPGPGVRPAGDSSGMQRMDFAEHSLSS